MSDQEKDLAKIDDMEIDALSDDELEDVAGGLADCETNSCSSSGCSNSGLFAR